MSVESCPIKVRQEADPACQVDCPFVLERAKAAERLRLIKSALLHDLEHATEQDQTIINSKIMALDTMIEGEELIVKSAVTTCHLPEWRRRILGIAGSQVAVCTSQTSRNYDRAVSQTDYSPVAEALTLIATRPEAQKFLIQAAAEAGVEMPGITVPQ